MIKNGRMFVVLSMFALFQTQFLMAAASDDFLSVKISDWQKYNAEFVNVVQSRDDLLEKYEDLLEENEKLQEEKAVGEAALNICRIESGHLREVCKGLFRGIDILGSRAEQARQETDGVRKQYRTMKDENKVLDDERYLLSRVNRDSERANEALKAHVKRLEELVDARKEASSKRAADSDVAPKAKRKK